jgi:biotin synthase-related radical SAM superfamily protein
MSLGASRIACSLEVWDEQVARAVTPGKVDFTSREQHLKALEYVAEKYGPAKAFSNLIIGIESFETLAEGAQYLAERGIMPSASVWMPMGRPVQCSMKPPNVDYYRRMKELFAELYTRYDLEPVNSTGLNVCVERDIWNYAVAG